ncbi:hypothetical protein E2C01_078774 [Portunus trituberculatus]|uniref:Uncharacterized protein n=1 Tax=Portunus trituberculatus TaxID=210409 RepID=A0A5B7IPL9_PORTR|nr:hypothetical protein [Portunus trituberculatus]
MEREWLMVNKIPSQPPPYESPTHNHTSDSVCLMYIFPWPLVLPCHVAQDPCLVTLLFTYLACRLTTPTPPTKKRRRKQDKKCQHAIKPHHATARTWAHLPPPSRPTSSLLHHSTSGLTIHATHHHHLCVASSPCSHG